MNNALKLLYLIALVAIAIPAEAHKPSDSYLTISASHSTTLAVRWDIALRDLELPLHLDANGDGEITWGELQASKPALLEYASHHFALRADGSPCLLNAPTLQVDEHSDGAYAVLIYAAACAVVPRQIDIDYSLLFDIDPSHRGLIRIDAGGASRSAVMSPGQKTQSFDLATTSRWKTFFQFLVNGVEHIWIGYDHILFLLSLLLPSVLVRRGTQWIPVDHLRQALVNVLAVVTAFTISHSITLTLAALGLIGLPSRVVESGIALSVLLAALNNVWPLVSRRVWLLAFGFGFVHGMGFASVLADLGLPREALAVSLAGFNVGVEIGQLSIVGVVVPTIYLVRNRRFYRPVILIGGSLVICVFATMWLLSRLFDLGLG
jgi:hypothetical protein